MTTKKDTTQYGNPHVGQGVSAAALAYANRTKGQGKYNNPVAGGPVPPIPRLNEQHRDNMTMANQAVVAGSFPQPQMTPMVAPQMHKTNPAAVQILPGDILPHEASKDPDFHGGVGAMMAQNQPHLAQKYGVMRNGQMIPPQQLTTGRPGISQGTVEGLQAIQDFQKVAHKAVDDRVEQESADGLAGAAARAANTAGDKDIKPLSKEEKEKLNDVVKNMDDFDFNTFREMMMKDILNNEDQRKIIETRLQPLSLDDLIIQNRVFQVVPVVPGKFEPQFQSVTAEEDLALKRLIWAESKSVQAPDQYLLDKYSLMGIALGVRKINNAHLPEHLDENGDFSEELFLKKFNRVLKLPFHMLSSLGINFFWFDVRVRRLFQAEAIKNG